VGKKFKYRKLREKEDDDSKTKRNGYFADRPKKELTPEKKKEFLHLFLYLVLWLVFTASVYITCTAFEFFPIVPIYAVTGLILFFVYVYFNGGIKRIDPAKFEKPDDMGYDEFENILERIRYRQKRSKYFLILFIPFPMILLMDYVIIVWGDKLSK